jgi:hypothetical protein
MRKLRFKEVYSPKEAGNQRRQHWNPGGSVSVGRKWLQPWVASLGDLIIVWMPSSRNTYLLLRRGSAVGG